ncbi:MAG TPA: hypothetical protein VN951_04335 [Pyrinomonadaceae bacterium]|nr:hypothetical protein [Pyrinomonadaceae bacterium]
MKAKYKIHSLAGTDNEKTFSCPISFSLSRRYDKLKLIGHQTDPLAI